MRQIDEKTASDEVIKVLNGRLASALYLQVSTISQALIFVTRSRGWSFRERPGLLLVGAFIIAQLVRGFKVIIMSLQWFNDEVMIICSNYSLHVMTLLHVSDSSLKRICFDITCSEDCDLWLWTKHEESLQVATLISALATSDFAGIHKIDWGWTGVIWLYNIIIYMLLDPIKFAVRYALSGRAWSLVYNQRVSETKTWLPPH